MTESSLDSTIEFVRSCITEQQDKFLALPWYAWREKGKVQALLANFEAERDTLVKLQKSLAGETESHDEAPAVPDGAFNAQVQKMFPPV